MSQFVKSSSVPQRNASKPIKASVNGSSEQPSILILEKLGVKVKDFAYESNLPPIKTIYCHPRQIQPAVVKTTNLKHQQKDNFVSQSSSHGQKKLERTSTEPVIPPTPDSTDTDSDSDDYFSQSRTSTELPPSIPDSDSTELIRRTTTWSQILKQPAISTNPALIDSESQTIRVQLEEVM